MLFSPFYDILLCFLVFSDSAESKKLTNGLSETNEVYSSTHDVELLTPNDFNDVTNEVILKPNDKFSVLEVIGYFIIRYL